MCAGMMASVEHWQKKAAVSEWVALAPSGERGSSTQCSGLSEY